MVKNNMPGPAANISPVPRPPRRLIFDRVCQVWFSTWVVALVLFVRAVGGLIHALPLASKTAVRAYSAVCGCCFRLAVGICPWIQMRWIDSDGGQRGVEGKPLWEVLDGLREGSKDSVMCVMNHSSFIDSLVASVVLSRCNGDFRFLMTEALFHIPMWGTMCRMLGHFPVFSKVNKSGSIGDPLAISADKHEDFSLDRKKQAAIVRQIDAHIKGGGDIFIYPEGTINRSIRRGLPVTGLLPFRFGGFSIAAKHEMQCVALIACGCDEIWPWRAGIGGLPGEITLAAVPLGRLKKDEDYKEASKRMHDTMERIVLPLYKNLEANRQRRVESTNQMVNAALGLFLLLVWGICLLPLAGLTVLSLLCIGVGYLIIVPASWALVGKSERTENST
ncbi:hypothetical protein AAMO2058_000368700 [Amorphochlora amoebiformis]